MFKFIFSSVFISISALASVSLESQIQGQTQITVSPVEFEGHPVIAAESNSTLGIAGINAAVICKLIGYDWALNWKTSRILSGKVTRFWSHPYMASGIAKEIDEIRNSGSYKFNEITCSRSVQ